MSRQDLCFDEPIDKKKKRGILKLLVYRYHGQEINRSIVHVLFLVERGKEKKRDVTSSINNL
jgi:hypothetical protein